MRLASHLSDSGEQCARSVHALISNGNPATQETVGADVDAATPNPLGNTPVCLLGPDIWHRDSLQAMLDGSAAGTCWAEDSHTFTRRQQARDRSRLARGLDLLFGTRDRSYLDYVLSMLDRTQSKLLIAYWGTLPLSDVVAIKRARPGLKIVALMLCFPLSLEPAGILRQKLALRQAMPSLDGLICPTSEMADYLGKLVAPRQAPLIGVVPPCWPRSMQPVERQPALGDHPNLIYVGRTDLSGATAHKADDIRPLMHEILDTGIELHHGQSPETDDGRSNRKPFPPLSNTELMHSMCRYDASLIAYNTDACRRTDRFDLTVPDRLLSSVAAGVPIAIPRKGYAASKTYLRDYAAVIEFDTAGDLRSQLDDRKLIHELRERAWDARHRYVAENHAAELTRFLARVIAH